MLYKEIEVFHAIGICQRTFVVVKMTIFESDFRQMNIFELIASLKKLVQSFGKKSASFRST
jgi:hypothetical protein